MEDLTSFENRVCSSEHIFACWVVVASKKKVKNSRIIRDERNLIKICQLDRDNHHR
jgi:hypothetical protein